MAGTIGAIRRIRMLFGVLELAVNGDFTEGAIAGVLYVCWELRKHKRGRDDSLPWRTASYSMRTLLKCCEVEQKFAKFCLVAERKARFVRFAGPADVIAVLGPKCCLCQLPEYPNST